MRVRKKDGNNFLNGEETALVHREYVSEKGILIYELEKISVKLLRKPILQNQFLIIGVILLDSGITLGLLKKVN
jgi:hypothetical protein